MLKSFDQIQLEIGQWAKGQFGDNPNRSAGHPGEGSPLGSIPPLLGMAEEVGELSHAYVYRLQGRGEFHNDKLYRDAVEDGLGDLLVFACDFANRERISLLAALNKTWDKVCQRRRENWNADKAREAAPAAVIVQDGNGFGHDESSE